MGEPPPGGTAVWKMPNWFIDWCDPDSISNIENFLSVALIIVIVEQVVYSIYHMILYSLPEGDGWLRLQ